MNGQWCSGCGARPALLGELCRVCADPDHRWPRPTAERDTCDCGCRRPTRIASNGRRTRYASVACCRRVWRRNLRGRGLVSHAGRVLTWRPLRDTCACGCGSALPANRRADRLYLNRKHREAHRAGWIWTEATAAERRDHRNRRGGSARAPVGDTVIG